VKKQQFETKTKMLRKVLRSSAVKSRTSTASAAKAPASAATRFMATQSGDDACRPTAVAKLHLEDGSTFTGLSFGSHESVEGEVRLQFCLYSVFLCLFWLLKVPTTNFRLCVCVCNGSREGHRPVGWEGKKAISNETYTHTQVNWHLY
jgi:hypothetical protein